MIKKGDIISTDEIKYGFKHGKPWAMLKTERKKNDSPVTVWIQNPQVVMSAAEVRIREILAVYGRSQFTAGKWKEWTNANVLVEMTQGKPTEDPMDVVERLMGDVR